MLPSPLADRLAQLAALGATGHGIDRRLFSAEDAQARTLFAQWARASKFTVEQDRAGNVFARRAGKRDGAAILSGSHLDTVPNGGAYDGAYGAVAALCALEELDAAGIVTEHPVEAVAWAGEEGSRFPLGCLGSGAFAGLNELAAIDALRDDDGVTFAAARARPRTACSPACRCATVFRGLRATWNCTSSKARCSNTAACAWGS